RRGPTSSVSTEGSPTRSRTGGPSMVEDDRARSARGHFDLGSDGRRLSIVVTCEHGGNLVPGAYRGLFGSPEAARALASHRGFDPGAAAAARAIAACVGGELFVADTTR